MLIGYARVSTVEQDAGFEAQERDLKAVGVLNSGTDSNRLADRVFSNVLA